MPLAFFLLTLLMILLLIVTTVMIVSMLLSLVGSIFLRVPFVPMPRPIMLQALAQFEPVKEGAIFYDLGSGDGRTVFTFAKLHPTALAYGLELGPFPYLISIVKKFWIKQDNAHIYYKNLFSGNFTDADYVYLYLFPEINQQLLPKLEKELKNGARVVVCDFPFEAKQPTTTTEIPGRWKHVIYVYDF